MTRIVAALLLSLSLLFSSATTATAVLEDEMPDAQAGRVYLDAVCPAITAGDTFSRVIWHGRKTISWAEMSRRLPDLKRVSKAYGRADQRSSRNLFNPPALWPADVDPLVTKLASADADFAYWLLAMSEARTAREWGKYWVKAKKVRFGTWGSQIRARLDLPPAGEGC